MVKRDFNDAPSDDEEEVQEQEQNPPIHENGVNQADHAPLVNPELLQQLQVLADNLQNVVANLPPAAQQLQNQPFGFVPNLPPNNQNQAQGGNVNQVQPEPVENGHAHAEAANPDQQ